MQDIIQALIDAFPEKITPIEDPFYPAVGIAAEDILAVLAYTKQSLSLNHLANISSVDYGEEFAVVYHLHSFQSEDKLMITVRVPRSAAKVSSAYSVYPTADWQEREVFDLMGISFIDHPNLVRVLLPDDYSGHPLRKDFKLVR